jgi:hypothetical protein
VRPLRLDHGTFDDHMIDLAILVSSLSFVLEISVGASGDGMDKIVALVRRLA